MSPPTVPSQEVTKSAWLSDQKLQATHEAQEFQRAFRLANGFRSRNTIKGLFAIFSNYAVVGVCVILSEQDWSDHPQGMALAIYVAACLVITSRMRGFENLIHEASHYNLFSSPSTHYTLQFLYSFPVLRVLEDYRRSHLIHHQHLGDPTRDPDLVRIVDLQLYNTAEDPLHYLFTLPFSGYIHWEYISTTFVEFWTSSTAYPSKLVFWASIIAGVYFSESFARLMVLYYMVPFFLLLPVLRYWAEASEHVGMDMTGKFGNSRSNLGLSHKWFMHPHNDGYHAVHHLHAQVPFHQLPDAHEALMRDCKEFRDKTVVSSGFAETFKQMATKKTTMKPASVN